MDIFQRLAATATRQSAEGDLPDRLLCDILQIAGSPERYRGRLALVELLIGQLEDFDNYAGAGCFGDSVSAGTIETTVGKIMSVGVTP